MQFTIGVDIGTSGTKAIAMTTDGKIIGNAYSSYITLPGPAGHHEQDPTVLFKAVLECLKDVLQQTNAPGKPLGIGFSSAMHGLIAVDKDGKPLTNMISWADLRSIEYARSLKNSSTGKSIYKQTGTPIHPMTPLCKLMWMKENAPVIFNSAYKFISIKEYIFYQLFGKYVIDHSVASGTALFDIYKRIWCQESLQMAGITEDRLSTPVSTCAVITGLKKEYAAMLSIDDSIPFIAGAGDGCLANLGSNAILQGDMAITIGTSGAARMICNQPKYDSKERIFNYILDDKLFVTGGPINNGAILLKWYAENFLNKKVDAVHEIGWFLEDATNAPAGSDGLIFLPYVQGERAPVWDASAKAVFFGIGPSHTRAHFMRAVVEGINYSLFQVAQSVQELVGEAQHIYASGGFIHSKTWVQWMTDLFGKEIQIANTADASSMGAAILALQATGNWKSGMREQIFSNSHDKFAPRKKENEVYHQYFPIYNSLYDQLKPSFSALYSIPH